VQGFAGVPRRSLSAHMLRAHLDSIGAPIVLAMPAPTITKLMANGQDAGNIFTDAGSVEVLGARLINFHITCQTGTAVVARPYRLIEGVRFIDDGEAPFIVPTLQGRRIPAPCDCEQVGLLVMRFVFGEESKYTLGVGMTP
jgi:hypothetical protein